MFNNIIYFIIVLIIFSTSFPGSAPGDPWYYTLGMHLLTWIVFLGYCRWDFQQLLSRFSKNGEDMAALTDRYHRLVLRLSILAILLFALDVYLFHLKYWLQRIPLISRFSVVQGMLAMTLFIFYLGTIWFFSYRVYAIAYQAGISRRSFIINNVKLNVPILFPWVCLTLLFDLLSLSPWSGPGSLLDSPEGQMVFFAVFLSVLMLFMPRFIQFWWGCKPFAPSEKVRQLEAFLREKGFKYRSLMNWPLFEGRVMTAGIMGLIARYRYILITQGLMEVLTIEELKSVLAHEMGHSKYRHLLFYILFFVGYMVLSLGLFDLFFYLFAAQPFFMKVLEGQASQETTFFYFVLSVPILLTMLIYFRFIMGFFMRHFERQADLYSAQVMGDPRPTISSLEKIALLSGKSRNLPSWHHFSIKERVEYLWRTVRDPLLTRRHNRLVAVVFALYLASVIGLGYLLNFSTMKENINYMLIGKALQGRLVEDPDNLMLVQNLAMIYHKIGRYREAIQAYEKIIQRNGRQAVALNNLAWILVTVPEKALRDPGRAVLLARRAVALERSPIFLDTLAEAYYANGSRNKAIETIKEAIALARENRGYYQRQLEKFQSRGRGV